MSSLFSSVQAGGLTLRNRLMRSATAEWLADAETGCPLPTLGECYRRLAEGGVGLIVTGHAFVEPLGRAHHRMSSIASDDAIAAWRAVVRPAQEVGARVIMQINHAGASVDPAETPQPISPSGIVTNEAVSPAVMTEDDILRIIAAFGQAARRAEAAGLDGVQIHGAHGYLVCQFLSAATNRREDRWGGDAEQRMAFLQAVIGAMRSQVSPGFPIWIKLGVAGMAASGLSIYEGARVAAACAKWGVACIEVSHAWGEPEVLTNRGEMRYLPLATAVRQAVGPDYPLALVNGFRTRERMEAAVQSGVAQLVSLCRPLIVEPELPGRLERGERSACACLRCGHCWPSDRSGVVMCRNVKAMASARGPVAAR